MGNNCRNSPPFWKERKSKCVSKCLTQEKLFLYIFYIIPKIPNRFAVHWILKNLALKAFLCIKNLSSLLMHIWEKKSLLSYGAVVMAIVHPFKNGTGKHPAKFAIGMKYVYSGVFLNFWVILFSVICHFFLSK